MAIDYALVLEDLQQRRVQLDAAIIAIRSLVQPPSRREEVAAPADENGAPTLPDKLVALLEDHATRIYGPDEIALAINAHPKAVRGALSRLSSGKKPRVQKVGRGRYASVSYRDSALFRTADATEGE